MSKLQSYVIKEVVNAFVAAFLALLFIMVLGFCVQLLQEGLDIVRLRGLSYYVVSFSVPWVLPSAFLTAVIIAFGRLSADNEITAMQSGGVHLLHVMAPVYMLALLLSAVSGYFHFHTLPLAGAKIQLLKFQAIKQVLLDTVALSAQRQFWFPPCAIHYDDFREGRMINLVVLETQGGLPRTIITAREGRIEEDTEEGRDGFVNLTLQDCAVTQLGEDEMGGRGTWKARQIVLPVRVGADPRGIPSDVKHLTLPRMFERREELLRKLAEHPGSRTFTNPHEVVANARQKLNHFSIQRAELKEIIDRHAEKLGRLRGQERRVLGSTVEQGREGLRAAEDTQNVLRSQLVAYTAEIEQLQNTTPGEASDYERIAELQRKMRETKAKLDALASEVEVTKLQIEQAGRQMRRNEATAQELAQELASLQKELVLLNEEWNKWRNIRDTAQDWEELRELRVRFHRRLALTLSVFVFAMVGIPLGIMTRKRSPMIAFGIGFAIMLLLFYPFLIIGQIVAEAGLVPVIPAMWGGNGISFLIGLILTVGVVRK